MSKQNRELNRTQRAAAVREAQARQERNRRMAIVGGVVVVLAAIVAMGFWAGGGTGSNPSGTPTAATGDVRAGDHSLIVGSNPDAPVKVVVYEDFLCPYCRELEMSTRDFLRADAKNGKVLVEYRPINLLTQHAYSARALNAWAAVLKNGTPSQALALHDLLFDNQPYELTADQVTDAQIAEWVAKVGADSDAVKKAMASTNQSFFDAVRKEMTDAKIVGTPTVLINGKQLQASSIPAMSSQIQRAIEQGAN